MSATSMAVVATPTPTTSGWEFNSTYNLTLKLGSLFALPGRFIAKWRRFDDLLNHDLDEHAMAAAALADARMHRGPPYQLVNVPGPLAFLTSGYAVGLLVMALLLNRIQHVVVPPRHNFAYRLVRSRQSPLHAVFYSIFPIDLSSTSCRLSLRIPSLYLLLKSLFLLFIITLQVSGIYPSWNFTWVKAVGSWAGEKEMAEICWSTFGAVCAALGVGALTRGLEGLSSSNTSPFNLFGYAFLLHIYSVPITHIHRGPPSRPDKHVLITIVLPLLQLTMIHALGIKKRWARQRLIPTTICSLLTLLHFHAVIIVSPASYPLLNYLPCLLESLLVLVTVLTCSLNALTQLLLEGSISRPLFGHARTLAPKWDEDFAVVLLRLGTASLEATGVAGLGNELGGVPVSTSSEVKEPNTGEGPSVELSRQGVVSLSHGNARRKRKHGFANEIKTVKVHTNDSEWWFDAVWVRQFTKFLVSLFHVARGFWRLFTRTVRSSILQAPAVPNNQRYGDRDETPFVEERPAGVDEDWVYRRFLNGDVISDDEGDYEPIETPVNESNPGSSHASEHASEDEDEDVDYHGEAVGLYSDLHSQESAPAPVLLAHMTTSNSPLTRRRYNQMLVDPSQAMRNQGESKTEWEVFLEDRRRMAFEKINGGNDESLNESRRNCVICTVEPRDVICWPCRCLALCDDCRVNLASRFAASKHICPCCRRNVEGFSRIYIP